MTVCAPASARRQGGLAEAAWDAVGDRVLPFNNKRHRRPEETELLPLQWPGPSPCTI
jgi:hypothetical protein